MGLLTFEELLALRAAGGRAYAEALRVDALSVGIYQLEAGADDPQQPHGEDEVYVVLRGQASITVGSDVFGVQPGSVAHVAAGVVHRFHGIREDLVVLVIFAPPEGSTAHRVGTPTAADRPGSGAPIP